MIAMNARLIPILMIATILMGSVYPFSQSVFNPSSATMDDDSEVQASADLLGSGLTQVETENESSNFSEKNTNSSDEDSDSSHPSTQGASFSAVVVEMTSRTLRLFPVSRMVKSSINRPVIVWSLAHSMDMRLSRVLAVERIATFSLSVVAPPVQAHAPPNSA